MSDELKPLEWKQNGTREGSVLARIDAVNLSYTIEPKSNVFRLKRWQFRMRHVYDDLGLFPTVEAAKAAAQADWEARITPLIAARPDATHIAPLVAALRAWDAWHAMPVDRGGKNGPRGRAFQKFLDLKNQALAALSIGEVTHE